MVALKTFIRLFVRTGCKVFINFPTSHSTLQLSGKGSELFFSIFCTTLNDRLVISETSRLSADCLLVTEPLDKRRNGSQEIAWLRLVFYMHAVQCSDCYCPAGSRSRSRGIYKSRILSRSRDFKVRDSDPESVRDPIQCGTNIFLWFKSHQRYNYL
jgi:hypothetical protein